MVTDAAEGLGVTRDALSDLLNGHGGVSPEMSIRLEEAGWSTADHWLRIQMQHDLWNARQRSAGIVVTPSTA
nr:HigA family addiction module antitoxin [uncultured Rhodopila sp.]